MAKPSPNIVVFFTDQQRWDTVGAYGNPLGLTPNLDRFARRGTLFEHAFTCQPVCGPARSAVQTGLYPTTTGCFRNGVPLPASATTLADRLKAVGYRTGYIGKWHLAGQEPVPSEQRGGYAYWLAANALEFTSDAYDTVVYDQASEAVHLPGYRVDALTDAAIRYIADNTDHPFLLFLSFLEPHHQNHRDDYPAPDVYRDTYHGRWMPPDLAALGGSAAQQLGGYYGMVKRLDEAFGRVLDALESLRMAEDTIVLYTCDHGNHFKTRNGEYKRSCHESSIRIPMVMGGGPFRSGGTRQELVSLIDVAPTLFDAAGLGVPEGLQGRSLVPLVERSVQDWANEVLIQISESQVGRALRTPRWKYSVSAPGQDGYRVMFAEEYVEEFLYDLQADPYELTNLAGLASHADLAARLRQRLVAKMREAGEPAAEIRPHPPREGGQRRVRPEELP